MAAVDQERAGQRSLFASEHAQAARINRDNLAKILADNRDTAFGRDYGFAGIRDVDGYRHRVPLSDYERFRPYVDAMRRGERDQLTVYPVSSYCCTSGTVGEAKHIPVSMEALARYGNGFVDYQEALQDKIGGKRLFINTFRTDPDSPIEPTLLFSEIYYRYLLEHGLLTPGDYAGGRDALFMRTPGERLYTKLWIALCEEDLTILETIFLYDGLIFFTYLERYWQEVLSDILAGAVPPERDLPERVRTMLESMTMDEGRAQRIRTACESGFAGIGRRLWPRLALISGISSRGFQSEDRALKEYLGEVELYYLCFCASECYIGAPVGPDDFGYYLLPRNAFYEFLPYREEDDTDRTYLPEELTPGARYEVVVTNFSGLYRYRMGDIVLVRGYDGQTPILEFDSRRSLSLNIAGEKMGAALVEGAVSAMEEGGRPFSEWCIGVRRGIVPGKYVFAAVAAAQDMQGTAGEVSGLLDTLLKERNPDYADLRGMNYIAAPQVLLLGAEDYGAFCKEAGLAGGHRKPKHVAAGGFEDALCAKWGKCYGNEA